MRKVTNPLSIFNIYSDTLIKLCFINNDLGGYISPKNLQTIQNIMNIKYLSDRLCCGILDIFILYALSVSYQVIFNPSITGEEKDILFKECYRYIDLVSNSKLGEAIGDYLLTDRMSALHEIFKQSASNNHEDIVIEDRALNLMYFGIPLQYNIYHTDINGNFTTYIKIYMRKDSEDKPEMIGKYKLSFQYKTGDVVDRILSFLQYIYELMCIYEVGLGLCEKTKIIHRKHVLECINESFRSYDEFYKHYEELGNDKETITEDELIELCNKTTDKVMNVANLSFLISSMSENVNAAATKDYNNLIEINNISLPIKINPTAPVTPVVTEDIPEEVDKDDDSRLVLPPLDISLNDIIDHIGGRINEINKTIQITELSIEKEYANSINTKNVVKMGEDISIAMTSYARKVISAMKWNKKQAKEFADFILDLPTYSNLRELEDSNFVTSGNDVLIAMLNRYYIGGYFIHYCKNGTYEPYKFNFNIQDIKESRNTNGKGSIIHSLVRLYESKFGADHFKHFIPENNMNYYRDTRLIIFPEYACQILEYHTDWLIDKQVKSIKRKVLKSSLHLVQHILIDILNYISNCFAVSITMSNNNLAEAMAAQTDSDDNWDILNVYMDDISTLCDSVYNALKLDKVTVDEVNDIITCLDVIINNKIDKYMGIDEVDPYETTFVSVPAIALCNPISDDYDATNAFVIIKDKECYQLTTEADPLHDFHPLVNKIDYDIILKYCNDFCLIVKNITNIHDDMKKLINANKFAIYQFEQDK